MRSLELNCIVPTCENYATENVIGWAMNELNSKFPQFCVCHVKGHSYKVIEQTNAYSLIQCAMSMCSKEIRVDIKDGRELPK